MQAAIAALDARIDPLERPPGAVQKLDAETAPLRQNYLLKVSTVQENYLVGQAAELVSPPPPRSTAARCPTPSPGSTSSPPGGGCAAPGFVVRENAEENALAVQFNNAGQVRLQLRSQFTKGLIAERRGQLRGRAAGPGRQQRQDGDASVLQEAHRRRTRKCRWPSARSAPCTKPTPPCAATRTPTSSNTPADA